MAASGCAAVVDVFKYYGGKLDGPIRMREPYRNDDCLKCHAGAVRWLKAVQERAMRHTAR